MANLTIPGSGIQLPHLLTAQEDPTAPVGLLLPPDPTLGGKMTNPVMEILHHAFDQANCTTMRINYRSIPRKPLRSPNATVPEVPAVPHKSGTDRPTDSRERWENCIDDITDAAVAVRFLQNAYPNARQVWVGGHSYGSWVALQLAVRRPDVTGFIAVSPPINVYDFSFLDPCPARGLFVTGGAEANTNSPTRGAPRFINRLTTPKPRKISHRSIPHANHNYLIDQHVPAVKTGRKSGAKAKLELNAYKPLQKVIQRYLTQQFQQSE